MPKTISQSKIWQHSKIGRLGRVVTGKTPPTKNQEYYGDKYPFITPTDISDNSIYVAPERYLSEEGAQKVASSKLPRNSVCYTCIASVGKIAITTEESFTNQQINSIIADQDKADYRYIFYLLRNMTPQIKGMVGGAASPIINKSAFEDIDIEVPKVETQKQIADVLSAYDDLIENNTQRIKILEEIAQAIYKEWFVYFRFPGNEKVKIVNSKTEFGRIPEGWKIRKLTEVFDFLEGPGIRNWQYTSTGYPFINIRLIQDGDINISSANFISEEEANGKYKHFHLKERDMVVSTSGTLGRSAIVRKEHLPLLLNTSVIRFMPIDGRSYAFMYQFLNADYFQNKILSMASGSAQPNFGPMHLKQIDVLVPSESVLNAFGDSVNSIYSGMAVYLSENQNLRQARDLLLPKLVTGELTISN